MLIADVPPIPPQLDLIQEYHRGQGEESIKGSEAVSLMKKGALREAALKLGIQSGSAHRFGEIKEDLNSKSEELERIFDFEPLLMEAGRVRPPVLVEASDTLTIAEGDRVLRISGNTYRIERQVGFVTAEPNWRQYLLRGVSDKAPGAPPDALLPDTDEEREVWREAVTEGWNFGIKQADLVMDKNFNLLRRDYVGMVTYHQLLKEGKVSAPQVARNDMGITGDDGELIIDDKLLRITVTPEFNTSGDGWRAPNRLEHSYPEQPYRPHYK